MGRWRRDRETGDWQYDQNVAESTMDMLGGIGGGCASAIGNGLTLLVVLGGVVGVLVFFGGFILNSLGIIKSDVRVTLAPSAVVSAEDTTVIMVSHNKKPKIYTGGFEQDNTAIFGTTNDNLSIYASHDGMLYDIGMDFIPSMFEDIAVEFAVEPSRAMLCTFVNDNGEKLSSSAVTVTSTAAETIPCSMIEDGVWLCILPQEANGLELTFTAEGYAPRVVKEDWNAYRLGELEVKLDV